MTAADQWVAVVDDDEAFRDSLIWLLEAKGLRVAAYPSAEAFLADRLGDLPDCLVVDIRMPGMTGLDLHDRLRGEGRAVPTIVITGHGELPLAVEAFRHGVVDFVEKPLDDAYLLERIAQCLSRNRDARERRERAETVRRRLETLTVREREVLDCIVAGKLNKQIADLLGISIKTVEVHRSRVMEKMKAATLADLIRLRLDDAR
jgi:RNA polymerase sigma factor (sigma-70 family)